MSRSGQLTVAQKRWKLLGDVLRKKQCQQNANSSISVRRFASFGLLQTLLLPRDEDGASHLWYQYSCPSISQQHLPYIRHLDGTIEWGDLLGFNNTGNVCVWPSEEVLTYYCLQRLELFKDKSVCELGGGMTCLAGMFLAVNSKASNLLLTDGNEQSVKNVEVTVDRNQEYFNGTKVSSRVLRWNDVSALSELQSQFDYVICADCLFFDDCREDLLNTLNRLLKPGGGAIILAPSRGGTFHKFLELAGQTFQVTKSENYDNKIWQLHTQNKEKNSDTYDENIHYPLLMNLQKDGAPDS